jgi:hypothetical protein
LRSNFSVGEFAPFRGSANPNEEKKLKRLTYLIAVSAVLISGSLLVPSALATTIFSEDFASDPDPGQNMSTVGAYTIDNTANEGDFGTYSYAGQGDTYGNPSTPAGSSYGAYYNDSTNAAESNSFYYDAGPVSANTTYTFYADAVHSASNPGGSLTVELFDGAAMVSQTSINESTQITRGDAQTISTSYTFLTPVTGDIIARLVFSDPGNSYQAWVGDTSLTAISVPEPAMAGLLLFALPLAGRRHNRLSR